MDALSWGKPLGLPRLIQKIKSPSKTTVRWTFLRFRADQLMTLCWKYLVPAGLVLVMFAAVWVHYKAGAVR